MNFRKTIQPIHRWIFIIPWVIYRWSKMTWIYSVQVSSGYLFLGEKWVMVLIPWNVKSDYRSIARYFMWEIWNKKKKSCWTLVLYFIFPLILKVEPPQAIKHKIWEIKITLFFWFVSFWLRSSPSLSWILTNDHTHVLRERNIHDNR